MGLTWVIGVSGLVIDLTDPYGVHRHDSVLHAELARNRAADQRVREERYGAYARYVWSLSNPPRVRGLCARIAEWFRFL